MQEKAIKIYGERNSGTNYFETLVRENFDMEILRYVPGQRIGKFLKFEILTGLLYEYQKSAFLGWKHGKPPIRQINKFNRKSLIVFTIFKNPYSFLLSLYKRPYHYRGNRNNDFKTFLQQNWQTIMRDNCNFKNFSNPMHLWNAKTSSFLELKEKINKRVIHLKYEEILANPKSTIEGLAEELKISLKNDQFKNVLGSTKKDPRRFSDYQEYYLNERWRKELDSEALEIINNSLDLELIARLNYSIIETV